MEPSIRQLINNLGSIILSLLLSFVVWIAATLQADPFTVRTFVNIPITRLNQPANTIVFEPIAEQVSVSARAPESVLQTLKSSNFAATMNLADVQPGVSTSVPISVTCDNKAVRIGVVDPSQQTVRLEALRTLTLPVELEVRGEVATGYQAVRPVIVPDEVTLYGPDPRLSEVVSVTGSVDIGGARESVVKKVSVAPLGAAGQLISALEWTPSQVEVRIGVSRKVGYKPDVEVVPDLRGAPAPGYRRGVVSVSPSTVTLSGLPSILDELPGFVKTEPISVAGATADLSVRSALTVPQGVAVVEVNLVNVVVEILPIQSSKSMTVPVEIQGVRAEWQAVASPPVVEVIVEGPEPIVAALTAEDLQIVVNLFGYNPGVHRLELDVLAPQDVTVLSVIPETIEVIIELAPTPTPLISPTTTVTPTLTTTP